jgi:hypothetical protein
MSSVSPQPLLTRSPTSAQELRSQHSSHFHVPKDLHIGHLSDESLRAGFVKKVYGILGAQLVLTALVCAFMSLVAPVREACLAMAGGIGYTVFSIAIFVPLVCVLCALHSKKHTYPANYYLLVAFTLIMSLNVGFVCAVFSAAGLGVLIIESLVITISLVGGLTIYVVWSDKDFSFMYGFLFASLCGMVCVGFLGLFIPALTNGILYPACGAVLFSGYVVYDTWKITKVFGYDDYIPAAIELYLDIINLFLYILQILARSD